MTGAKAYLRNSTPFDMFLMAAEDYGTKRGKVAHYGCWERSNPGAGRVRFGYMHWLDCEAVAPNTAFSNGPACVRRFTGQPEGWRLPKRWRVLDIDAGKTGEVRSVEYLVAHLPGSPFCIVPSSSVGNYHVWYLMDRPIDGWAYSHLNSHLALWGSDPAYHDVTLAWNPIYRSIAPRAGDGEATWWSPKVWAGEFPIQRPEDLHHPNHGVLDERIGSDNVSPVDGPLNIDLDDLVESMAVMDSGAGRWQALRRYVWKVGCSQRRALGRDLSYAEVLAIGHEGNAIFPTPKSTREVEGQVRFFLESKPWERQSIRGKRSAEAQARKADDRYLEYLQLQLWLGGSTEKAPAFEGPPVSLFPRSGRCHTPSVEQQSRADEYAGRRGSAGHVAYVLGVEPATVRQVLSRGRKRAQRGDAEAA